MSDDIKLRVCARCHATKPVSEFPIKDKVRGTFTSYCRPCRSEYATEHYRKNVAAYVRRARERAAIDRRKNRAFIAEYLETHPCVDCGERDPLVLEFDHRDPESKSHDVSRLIHTSTIAALCSEIAKCDVRCGNCHRRRTLLQFGSYRVWMGALDA